MTFEIDEMRLSGLTSGAKEALKDHIEAYASDVIKEATLIEEGSRAENASREITATHILHAAKFRRYSRPKKSGWGSRLLKLCSSFSCLLVGFFFDAQGFQGKFGQMVAFIVFLIIAIVSVTISTIKED